MTAHPMTHELRGEYDLENRPLVLVIHRSPFVRQALFVTLDLDGFDVLVAADGAEATALLTEMSPRVVVADLLAADDHMEDFIGRLRSQVETTHVQIVDFAGNARPSTGANRREDSSDSITSVNSLTSLLDVLRPPAGRPGRTLGSDLPAA